MSAKSKTSLTARQRAETLRRVMQWVRPYGLSVGGSLAAAALSVAAQLYIPILCGRAIDQMFGPGRWICQGSCALPCRWLLRRLQRLWHNGF